MSGVDPYSRSLEAYELAYARVCQALQEWQEAGRPLMLIQRNQMVGRHPLWTSLREAAADSEALGRRMGEAD